MSTVPPPIAAPLDPGAQPSQPGLSETARLMNVFIAPRKTFEDLKRNSSWWVPWLITTAFGLIFAVIAVQKMDTVRIARQQIEQSKLAQRQFEQLSPEQQEQNLQIRAKVTKYFFFIIPILGIVGALIVAAVLMAIFNFGFAAEVPFSRALAIVFYSFLPRIILAVLLCVSVLVAADPNTIDIAGGNPMPTNPAFFMDPQGNKFLYGLLSGLDVMALWVTALLGLGFSAASPNRKLTAKTGITTMMVIYGVLVLIGATFKAIF
jgi:Yip1 domain